MVLLLFLALLPLTLPWRIGLLRRPLLPLVAVAAQAGFARWPSSGTACRLQWATWSGCSVQGHSFSRPSMAKLADFLLWLRRSKGFRLSSIRGYCLMLSYRCTLSFGPSSAPFGCLPLAEPGCSPSFLGPCGVSSPSIFLVVRIAPFGSSPLASQVGSLLCGLSDGHPYWRAPGALPLFFVRPRFCLFIICPYICCQM